MSKHQIKVSYNKAWKNYVKLVQDWHAYKDEPMNSENNQKMNAMFVGTIMPNLNAMEAVAKLNGVKTNKREEVCNYIA